MSISEMVAKSTNQPYTNYISFLLIPFSILQFFNCFISESLWINEQNEEQVIFELSSSVDSCRNNSQTNNNQINA